MTIDVVLLGTGNPIPDRERAGAATLVRAGGRTLLFDAGRGVCMRLVAAGVLPLMLDAVFLTHLHSDHICDLNDVITTQWVMSPVPKSLPIYGPPRTREVTDGVRAMLRPDVEYRLAHHADLTWEPQVEVFELTPGVVFDEGGLRIVAARTDHRPVEPTLGFRVECEGKVVVIAGDTVPCAGLDELCGNADVYVQTASCSRIRSPPPRPVRPTSGSRSRANTSRARSSSVTISRPSPSESFLDSRRAGEEGRRGLRSAPSRRLVSRPVERDRRR